MFIHWVFPKFGSFQYCTWMYNFDVQLDNHPNNNAHSGAMISSEDRLMILSKQPNWASIKIFKIFWSASRHSYEVLIFTFLLLYKFTFKRGPITILRKFLEKISFCRDVQIMQYNNTAGQTMPVGLWSFSKAPNNMPVEEASQYIFQVSTGDI